MTIQTTNLFLQNSSKKETSTKQFQTKTLILNKTHFDTKEIFWALGFGLTAVITPMILAHTPQNQWITGTVINCLLFLAVWRSGVAGGFLVAVLPSSIALIRGLLPPFLVSALPVIIFSNFVLIGLFYQIKNRLLTKEKAFLEKNFNIKLALAISLGALAKFLILFSAYKFYFSKFNETLAFMLSYPQLITALSGGIVAFSLIQFLAKPKTQNS